MPACLSGEGWFCDDGPPFLLPQVARVGLPELRRLMLSGDMLLPSVATCFLALERIQQRQQREGQQRQEGAST